MQGYIGQQVRLWKRQRGLPEDDRSVDKRKQYLAKLGLTGKLEEASNRPPWHLGHMATGDVFEGSFTHPDMNRGQRLDVTLTVNSATEGTLSSGKGGFETDVTIQQDFPIAHEAGSEARNRDIAAYIFSKFNKRWRDFNQEVPKPEELEYIQLDEMRLWFNQVAQVDNFPPEDQFRGGCADPGKGMSLDEFLKYTLSEDPEYLEKTFEAVYTGRRLRVADQDMELEGDFIKDAAGAVFGYVTYNGRPGGTFELDLTAAE